MVSSSALLGVGSGVFLYVDEIDINELTIDSSLKKLAFLSDKNLIGTGKWDPVVVFNHCAQSVEYSMSQFPEHKSSLFKNTVGKLAFSVFTAKGKMTHGLSEPIPGAPLIKTNKNIEQALARLKQSLIAFDKYQGSFAPHFAYGELTKREYELAHIMHLNNHLNEIKVS